MDTLTVTATLLDYTPDLPADKALPDAPILEVHDRALLNVAAWADGGRNWWRAYSYLQGNSSAVVLLRQAPGGAAVAVATVQPPPGFKIDSATATQNGDGPDIIVTMTVHQAISDPNRAVQLADAVVPGLAVPFPGGTPRGLAAPFAPAPPPEPTPAPSFTLDELVDRFVAELKSSDRNGMGKLTQKLAQNGATDALAAHGVTLPAFLQNQDALLQVLRDGLAPWARDRAFEGASAALHPQGPTP